MELHAKPTAPAPSATTQRLARLARIWGELQYLHPALLEKRVDLDGALAQAILRELDASSEDDEAAAVSAMLGILGDPVTRVEALPAPGPASQPRVAPPLVRTIGDVVVVHPSVPSYGQLDATVAQARDAIVAAKSVIVDLRVSDAGWERFLTAAALNDLAGALTRREVSMPGYRAVRHEGYTPQRGASSGGFRTYLTTDSSRVFAPSSGPHPTHVVFIVNASLGAPPLALAMQRVGDATVVSEGDPPDPAVKSARLIPLGEHHAVRLRTLEEPYGAPVADVRIEGAARGASSDAALEAAIAAIHHPSGKRPIPPAPPEPRWVADALYESEMPPSMPRRLLGLFRFWNVIRFFYPYTALMGEPWDEVLLEFIPRFQAASTSREYELLVRELTTRVPDSHISVEGHELWRWLGDGHVPFQIQRVEGLPVITGLLGDPAAVKGVSVGDVLVSIGGEAYEARSASALRYVAGSNAWTRLRDCDWLAGLCPAGTESVVQVRGADGSVRDARVRCGDLRASTPSADPPFRVLPGNIGYVDLRALEAAQVNAMFDALKQTSAIIFDMRGYPKGTAWSIAPRLGVRTGSTPGAQIMRPVVDASFFTSGRPRLAFDDLIAQPRPGESTYSGKTVMLINGETQSQAEHTALFFEAAAGTKFVGSASAGTDGDITTTCLPGGLCITFSGNEVRHADGRQLQRVGITPDVLVRPTLEGIRTGHDEVLEHAVEYLTRQGSR